MKNIRRNVRMEYLYGLGRSMKANAICLDTMVEWTNLQS